MGQGEVQNWMKSTPGHDVQMRYPGEWKFAGISAWFLQAFFAKDSQNVSSAMSASGGVVDADETVEAARRELEEEFQAWPRRCTAGGGDLVGWCVFACSPFKTGPSGAHQGHLQTPAHEHQADQATGKKRCPNASQCVQTALAGPSATSRTSCSPAAPRVLICLCVGSCVN